MRNEYDFSNSNRNVYAEKGTKQFNVKKYVPLENIKLETMYGLSQEQMFKVADIVNEYYFKQEIMVEWDMIRCSVLESNFEEEAITEELLKKADEAFVEIFLNDMTEEYKELYEGDLSLFDDRRTAFAKYFYEEKLIARLKESK